MLCVTARSAYTFWGWWFLSTAFFVKKKKKKKQQKRYELGPPSNHPPKQLDAA